MERVYFLFRSTHDTLKAESLLKAAGMAAKVVMKPAAIRSDCGLAVRAALADREQALSVLGTAGLPPRSEHAL